MKLSEKELFVRFPWLCKDCQRKTRLDGCNKPTGECPKADYPTNLVRLPEYHKAQAIKALAEAAETRQWTWRMKLYRRAMQFDGMKLLCWTLGGALLILFWDGMAQMFIRALAGR